VSPDEYVEVLTAFSSTLKIKVSDYCVDADKEPDTMTLQDDVKNKSGKFLLIGLGDYLASKIEVARQTLLPYKDLELQNNGHVTILLSAHMYPIIKEIHDSDPRVRMRIVLPKAPLVVDVVNSSALVYGIKAYLAACEKGESVGSVKTLRNLQNMNVINPENAYDELRHKFPNEFKKLSTKTGTANNWGELLENLNKSKKTLRQYLGLQNFDSLEYNFMNYAKKNDYLAWLYFINLKLNTNSQSYLGFAALRAETQESLFNVVKMAILDVAVTDKLFKPFYEQRKKILKSCDNFDMADFIPKIAVRGIDRVSYLTDNTKIERQTIIISLCDGAKDNNLHEIYPDLYFYMQDFVFEDERFTKYFSAYKRCKVTNCINERIETLVAEYAKTRPYNSLQARSSLFSNLDDGNTFLLFLDAMGVEYLGYVKEKCAVLGLRFISKVARAELPTITSLSNKAFYDEWLGKKETPIKDLDDVKHKPERGYDHNNSPYPIHLADELDVIKIALERAKMKLQMGECKKVVIASDHGASRLAVISPTMQIPNNGCEVKSNGRYCVGDDLPSAVNIVTEVDGKFAIITDYARFEGSRTASVEVHGGATLEEVIVPIIEITLLDIPVDVDLENSVVEISYNTVPTLNLIITPDCVDVTASVNGKMCEVEKLEKSKYKVTMPDLKKGNYVLDVFESQNKLASKEFIVKSKGFAERDLF